ncbi:MAG: hypothetical protein P8Q26_15450 [Ascidiaceihabitans sp.]|nr:hypothetical protein [Ascidiaceihabitans sp.]
MFWNSKPIVSDDMMGWIHESYDWVDTHRPNWTKAAQLITPTREFFDVPKGQNQATAQTIANRIAQLMALDVQITVDPLPKIDAQWRHDYTSLGEVAGEYHHDPLNPLIRYNPELMAQPIQFINTMAHELMHARLADIVDRLPGGYEAHELATDLHCIIAGFGCFQLQAAEQAGWSGYMTQPSRAAALAVFLERRGLEPMDAEPFLSARPRKWLNKAWKQI